MDRDRAAQIQKHLLEASEALDRATEAMLGLDKEERKAFAETLFEIHDALHFGLLRSLYFEHPELKPPEDQPRITCALRWSEVSLPDLISEADIDAAIADVLTNKWQKTAVVVAKAFQLCERLPVSVSSEMLGARIVVLVESRRIDSAGDPRMWRHSEVRLRP